ncbi:hypothetical protein BURPS406E_D0743 [Burkholderia pseudomallei 406e]|uniref:Uncharacterized protein n=1 Tax=Burkholderia mallei (strain NCTC 10229) TaxID=412022 RepID=A2S194_BURM9|nr:hypothetical protein BMA10229_1916 [Burkholderia mallei NCTC 10229]ABO01569.1 hypothetical protein BMA10247_A0592 [Burkholderia mallei NCTC 10247]EDK55804.1 hypothetical protein BMAFMH_E0949 [Burkholderia mallei FMH]EDK86353.1 hypothetical protein BMA721280_I0444 [Burkholderia mallei 2002721280]EDO88535.1 hypothetical protein BURPS406E_D0743 [Burkholderia pseudomallei 406e]EDU12623.1 hypothetical protein BURPS1655_D1538 [Burkholderia pseudomallei 1655]EMP73529.1 hypothetical protein D512_2
MLSNEHSGGAAVPRASTMPNAAPLRKRTSDTPRIRYAAHSIALAR